MTSAAADSPSPSRPQLAHVNVSKLQAPLDSPEMATLVRALSDVNWLAEQSAGFVWRHRAEGAPTVLAPLARVGEVTVTVSVWKDFDSLQAYVYRSAHGLFMQQRGRWFEPIGGFTTALWWVDDGAQPAIDDAVARLENLRAVGPTPYAFSLRRQFRPEDDRSQGRRPAPTP